MLTGRDIYLELEKEYGNIDILKNTINDLYNTGVDNDSSVIKLLNESLDDAVNRANMLGLRQYYMYKSH